MTIAVLLLLLGHIASVLSEELVPGCVWFSVYRVTASGTVYCDVRSTQVAESGTVTLMEADLDPDDVAEPNEYLPGFKAHVSLVNGHFKVGGGVDDYFAGDRVEPYLLVKGVCPVENNRGVVERKQIVEKIGLPCDFACNQDRIDVHGLGILLDGVNDREICS